MSKAKGYIGNKLLQFELKMMLMNACPMISDVNLARECTSYVTNYFDEFIKLIEAEAEPQIVCSAINMCKGMNATVTKLDRSPLMPHVRVARSAAVNDDTKCILCEFVLKEIDSLVSDNATEQEILDALDKVCNILPSSIRAQCVDFINTYGPTVFFLLSHELDPKYVCTLIGLCQSSAPLNNLQAGSSEMCGMCENIVQYLDSFLILNSTIEDFDHLLEKVCSALPGELPEQCKDFVEQNGGAVVYLIAEQLDPKSICTILGLCNGQVTVTKDVSSGSKLLLNSYPCNKGPKYWCQNPVTAMECKAYGYCKTRSWPH